MEHKVGGKAPKSARVAPSLTGRGHQEPHWLGHFVPSGFLFCENQNVSAQSANLQQQKNKLMLPFGLEQPLGRFINRTKGTGVRLLSSPNTTSVTFAFIS